MKKVIKHLALLLTLVMIVGSFSVVAFASDTTAPKNSDKSYTHEQILESLKNSGSSKKTSVNEYELLKSFNKQYQEDMRRGSTATYSKISNTTLDAILNYKEEYTKKIRNLQSWTDEQLKFVGYDDAQINAIRNFDGSEEMMAAAATTVSVDAGFRNKKYTSSGRTTVDLIVAFNSKGIQSNYWNDLFCVVWSSPLSVSSCVGYVEYRDGNYLNSETVTHNPRAGGVYAREIEFPKYILHNVTGKYVYAGSMILHLSSNTKVSDFAAYAAYGYSSIALTGVSVSYPAGLSISFGNGMSNAGSAYAYL